MSAVGHPVVGIIGGMGPEATVELMRRVVAQTAAQDDQDHVHLIVESNPKIPSRIAHLIERTGPDPTRELIRIARNLEAAGATLLAMPCNTAHGYADAIRAAVSIPLLDMVGLTATQVAATVPRPRVGLLASTAVLTLGLYSRAFAAGGGTVIVPERQDEVMALIRSVKRGDSGRTAGQALEDHIDRLARNVDVVILACTELSVIAGGAPAPVPVADSLQVLTQAIVRAAGAVSR